jgi:uncharacterized membrane protein
MTVKRFWEIDSLRGIAIVMMVIFHLFFDLDYFGELNLNFGSGFWWWFGRLIASTFIFLVGVSLTLSFSRAKRKKVKHLFRKYFVRGVQIFGWGLIITLLTWFFFRQGFIFFGILHFIGLSIILSYPFLNFKYLNLILGSIFIGIGLYLQKFVFDFSWLIWVGLKPASFYTLDYFPIFPWFGLVLIGLFFGKLLYPKGKRGFKLPETKDAVTKALGFLGRNSLLIYLIHQPILIIILKLFVI